MARFGATVAAYKNVEAFLSRDKAKTGSFFSTVRKGKRFCACGLTPCFELLHIP